MTDEIPNLVQRAAERLRHSVAKTGPSASPARTGPVATPQVALEPLDDTLTKAFRPAPSSRLAKSVTISPASLASNGIAMPSAGLSRTVQEFRLLKREVIGNIKRPGGAINRVVLITSAQPAEGKTFMATNLALALAYEKEMRVLLMDADPYRHSVMHYLGVSADRGWLDVITDTASLADVLLRTNLPNLDLLPSGQERAGIPELMSSSRMSSLFDELNRQDPLRIIIVDSVPCLSSTEPSILAGLAAQTLLIVAAHETARDQIEASLHMLKASPGVSLVLNKAHPTLTEQFKGYDYSYPSTDKAA